MNLLDFMILVHINYTKQQMRWFNHVSIFFSSNHSIKLYNFMVTLVRYRWGWRFEIFHNHQSCKFNEMLRYTGWRKKVEHSTYCVHAIMHK